MLGESLRNQSPQFLFDGPVRDGDGDRSGLRSKSMFDRKCVTAIRPAASARSWKNEANSFSDNLS